VRRERALIAVVLVAIGAALFVIFTSGELPDAVAAHFNLAGEPDRWTSHQSYVALFVGFLFVYPALMVLAFTWLPKHWPHLVNIPNRDYWFEPERREASLEYLAHHGCWFSIILLVLIAAIHYTILVAHQTQPVTLPMPLFSTVLGCFVLAVTIWTVQLFQHFRTGGKGLHKDVSVNKR